MLVAMRTSLDHIVANISDYISHIDADTASLASSISEQYHVNRMPYGIPLTGLDALSMSAIALARSCDISQLRWPEVAPPAGKSGQLLITDYMSTGAPAAASREFASEALAHQTRNDAARDARLSASETRQRECRSGSQGLPGRVGVAPRLAATPAPASLQEECLRFGRRRCHHASARALYRSG